MKFSKPIQLVLFWLVQKSNQFDWEKPMFTTLVSPEEGKGIVINQDAYINLLNLDAGGSVTYKKNIGNNVTYIYLIDGKGTFGETSVSRRDAVGFASGVKDIAIKADSRVKVLILEVPL